MYALGLDKLAQQKRSEAGGKALPALGKRSRLDLDDSEEVVLSTNEKDAGSKGQARHYRSSRIDTPSHPGMYCVHRTTVELSFVMLSLVHAASYAAFGCIYTHVSSKS